MTSLVFLVHGLIVFLVPALFGWIALRRLVRESDLLVLVPGSVVFGIATVMAAVNELRHYLEMNLALWTIYKLLLLATLLLVVFTSPTRGRIAVARAMRGPWRLLLVVAGATLTAVYFGIPAFGGVLNDAWWGHYPLAIDIQTIERFPLHHMLALDDPLYYHYGPDIIAASWSFLLEMTVQRSFALQIAVFALAAFLLSVAIVTRFSGRFWCGLLAGVFVVAGGNLRFLFMLGADPSQPLTFLRALNSQTIQGMVQMVFTPSHAVGVPLSLMVIVIFRHFRSRPTLLLGTVLGLLLGSLSLVAEWYFLPLIAAIAAVTIVETWRASTNWRQRAAWVGFKMLPLGAALIWSLFNNSYISGITGKYWMPYHSFSRESEIRLAKLGVQKTSLPKVDESPRLRPSGSTEALVVPEPPPTADPVVELSRRPPTPPNLIPLRLNIAHFGSVPTWESAGANENPYISIFSAAFLSELLPVVFLGLPLGLWWAWKRRKAVPLVLGTVALISAAPPTLLDWDLRSVDFLRFFTVSFTCSALLFAWIVGEWMTSSIRRFRYLGHGLAVCALINPIALGVIGLIPSTLTAVKDLSFRGASLSHAAKAAATESKPVPEHNNLVPAHVRQEAFERMSVELGERLFAVTKGRERALVMVNDSELPPLKVFPPWMKFTVLARMPVPIGWYWEPSAYADTYRLALQSLSKESLVSLDVRWVVLTNAFDHQVRREAILALGDRSRFAPVVTVRSAGLFMTAYRITD